MLGKQSISKAGQLASIRLRRCLKGSNASTDRFVSYFADAGMCNRLRSHLIADSFARRTGRNLVVRWKKNRQCGAAFEELFCWGDESFGRFRNIAIKEFPGIQIPAEEHPLDDELSQLVLFDVFWQWVTPTQFLGFLGQFATEARKWLTPLPFVSERVDAASDQWPDQMVGVHVRRGDFREKQGWAIGTESYVEAMRRIREESGEDCYFFLASDASDDELAPLLAEFRGRLFRSPPSPRDDPDGVTEALITMLLLSKTDRLLLTPRSSFGETAAFLGGQPYEYVT